MYDLWNPRVRDSALFLIGIAGVVHELFFITEPRVAALVFLGSLIGMPFVLGADKNDQTGEPR